MVDLIRVTADNVDRTGFFCKMSARGKPGYEQKLAWLKDRFAEGLEMRLLGSGERGFVEFIPGTYAWRAIKGADAYIVIHCLWVVGRSKGKGFGAVLLDEAESHARSNGFAGVAAVTSGGNWLIGRDILASRGYRSVASSPPAFDLMVNQFDAAAPEPEFCGEWDTKLAAHPKGLVVYRSAQCPYLDDAVHHASDAAQETGLSLTEVPMACVADIRTRSPTPYGVYALALNGRFIAHHYLLKKDILARIASA